MGFLVFIFFFRVYLLEMGESTFIGGVFGLLFLYFPSTASRRTLGFTLGMPYTSHLASNISFRFSLFLFVSFFKLMAHLNSMIRALSARPTAASKDSFLNDGRKQNRKLLVDYLVPRLVLFFLSLFICLSRYFSSDFEKELVTEMFHGKVCVLCVAGWFERWFNKRAAWPLRWRMKLFIYLFIYTIGLRGRQYNRILDRWIMHLRIDWRIIHGNSEDGERIK